MIVSLPNGYAIDDDTARLDVTCIHGYLSESYWAAGRSLALVRRSLEHSLCLGAYAPDGSLAGFARVVSDRAVQATLSDVFVLPAHRGHGLGKHLVATALGHPELAAVRRWTLNTKDAHGLYASFGFTPFADADRQMQLLRTPD